MTDKARDRSDTKLTEANAPALTPEQLRFLAEYRQHPVVAAAARLSGVNRATAYRWRRIPAFTAAMVEAETAHFAERRARAIAAEEARRKQRQSREQGRHAQRCESLARARAAKRPE